MNVMKRWMNESMATLVRITAGGLAALALATGPAEAIDLRSWDQRINNPASRFVVLNTFDSEAVLDKETQIVWERAPENAVAGYTIASQICFSRGIGGRRGWRLPSLHELNSLLDPDTADLPAGHPFIGVPVGSGRAFWTNTANRSNARPYVIELGGGYFPYEPGQPFHSFWCVRGPGGEQGVY